MTTRRRLYGARATIRVGAVLAASALGTAGCAPTGDARDRYELRGSEMPVDVSMPDLVFSDTRGRPFDLRAETEGYVTLLFFGYTNCPDICPVHMANLGAVWEELRPEVRDGLKVVFVTTDPDRDTPEVLREWLNGFSPTFVGLRGPLEEIDGALASMMLPGIAVIPSEHAGMEPVIGHPAAVLAFDRDGVAQARYAFGVTQSDWLHDIPLLVQEP